MAKNPAAAGGRGRPKPRSLGDPTLYFNRELSSLEFHQRVAEQAKDPAVPLLERLRFLAISCAILDEFFEIRVGSLREQVDLGLATAGPDGLGARTTLSRIRAKVLTLVEEQYRILNQVLLPALEEQGVVIYRRDAWTSRQKQWIKAYFARNVLPVLTPVGLDPSHPFPRVLNKSLNFIVALEGKDAFGRRSRVAVVQAPRVLPRLIALPHDVAPVAHGFVLLSSVIHAHVNELFRGMRAASCDQFRVTRNSDLWVDEEEVKDLLLALKGELARRHFGRAVRLEVSKKCPSAMIDYLLAQFALSTEQLYRVDGPVNLHRLDGLYGLVDRPDLKYPPFVPGLPAKFKPGTQLFDVLRERDVLLHHPYQSFAPVIDLVRQAASDPQVLAIKQTLYRSGADSPLGKALLEAARNGKEVTAVIELRARFDEAANIDLASRLQEAGAKVVYGIVGYKAHAKMLMIVRREASELRRYIHLGTGNYNADTARQYTDFGLMTSDRDVGEDVHDLFQQVTGLGKARTLKKLIQTPFRLHAGLLELIAAEARAAASGATARIIAKMNSLVEPEIIRALYRASQAGVSIDLIVRSTCSLRPGVPGVSENIRVRSIVGRFLEHARVFHFHAGGKELTFLSSADWMQRNFFRRVEVTFPVETEKNRLRVIAEGLKAYLDDNQQVWEMRPDGSYARLAASSGATARSAQRELLESLASSVARVPED